MILMNINFIVMYCDDKVMTLKINEMYINFQGMIECSRSNINQKSENVSVSDNLK